ncbi:MAG: hypothetical protein ABI042_07995 [Verrucomicrobiota bacterium]
MEVAGKPQGLGLMKYLNTILAIIICSLAAGFFGYRAGVGRVVTAHIASAISASDALQKLQTRDSTQAIRVLERLWFADSVAVLSESGWRVDSFRSTFLPSLISYRQTYRTNQADWTPMERHLETLLKR